MTRHTPAPTPQIMPHEPNTARIDNTIRKNNDKVYRLLLWLFTKQQYKRPSLTKQVGQLDISAVLLKNYPPESYV
ncbi:hypothetical protein NDU88_004197 [Pleurodeles waltl]|uniref:Uncharacterized protein n=1 Tax=Pleurodeles waltl TaxID=8319 RepID=A0AAV7MAZ6_PLEWA|nr:hypothetical protein NDU88_004197 [Pleurodeles waltl]